MQRAVEYPVEEWFFAETIAGGEQFAAALMVDGKRKHAFETLDAGGSKFLERVHNGFSVRVGLEAMTARDEIAPECAMVVDLAVEDDPASAIFVRQRLRSTRAIDDGQPSMSQRHVSVGEKAVPVGPAMRERVSHRRQGPADTRVQHTVDCYCPTNAAHCQLARNSS